MSQSKLILSGGGGLVGCLLLTILLLYSRRWIYPLIPPLLNQPIMMWTVFLFLMALALIEIPFMIFGFRKILEGQSAYAERLVIGGNILFVFFPAVYAAPNLLMSHPAQLWMGILISATVFARHLVSLIALARK